LADEAIKFVKNVFIIVFCRGLLYFITIIKLIDIRNSRQIDEGWASQSSGLGLLIGLDFVECD